MKPKGKRIAFFASFVVVFVLTVPGWLYRDLVRLQGATNHHEHEHYETR